MIDHTEDIICRMSAKSLCSLFWFVLSILPMTGQADPGHGELSSIRSKISQPMEFIQAVSSGNNSLSIERFIAEKTMQPRLFEQDYNDGFAIDGPMGASEQLAHEMIEQALELCQTSQEYWQSGQLDRAIEFLDQAYLLVMGVNEGVGEKLAQQKEDMRFMISKRIFEIYSSRKKAISGSQNEIPIEINKDVQKEIDLYTRGKLSNHFIASYKRSGKYRQMIADMLEDEGLPPELSWLPLVESGFRVKALSNRRALGLWQFIPSTGYKFGLNRNRYIDERLDPLKSTRAAIDYLKMLHLHFGDWSTVLAAYNCGESRVLRVIRRQKIRYLDNFWDLYAHLPQETARYVPKFLATLHIVNNLEKYGLESITVDPPLKFEALAVTAHIPLRDVADITGINFEILDELNPELRQSIVPGGMYTLKIPEGSRRFLLANIDQVLRLNPAGVDFLKHRVRSGETLSLIARRYRTSVANIMLANNLNYANHIVTGKTLKIPQGIKTSLQSEMES